MSLFASVLRVRLGQLFGNDQLGDVDPIAQQVRYSLFGVLNGSVWITVNKDLLQATVDQVSHKRAIVAAYCLNAFTIHLVMYVRPCEVQSGITLLVDEKVWKIDLTGTVS